MTEYTLTDEEWDELMVACQPVPYMVMGGVAPLSQQDNANRAWQRLADKHGFDWRTVKPVVGKSQKTFQATLVTL